MVITHPTRNPLCRHAPSISCVCSTAEPGAIVIALSMLAPAPCGFAASSSFVAVASLPLLRNDCTMALLASSLFLRICCLWFLRRCRFAPAPAERLRYGAPRFLSLPANLLSLVPPSLSLRSRSFGTIALWRSAVACGSAELTYRISLCRHPRSLTHRRRRNIQFFPHTSCRTRG